MSGGKYCDGDRELDTLLAADRKLVALLVADRDLDTVLAADRELDALLVADREPDPDRSAHDGERGSGPSSGLALVPSDLNVRAGIAEPVVPQADGHAMVALVPNHPTMIRVDVPSALLGGASQGTSMGDVPLFLGIAADTFSDQLTLSERRDPQFRDELGPPREKRTRPVCIGEDVRSNRNIDILRRVQEHRCQFRSGTAA